MKLDQGHVDSITNAVRQPAKDPVAWLIKVGKPGHLHRNERDPPEVEHESASLTESCGVGTTERIDAWRRLPGPGLAGCIRNHCAMAALVFTRSDDISDVT
jgi:hypothetical protein